MRYLFILSLLISFSCTISRNEKTVSYLRVGSSSAHVNPSEGMFIAGDKQNRKFTSVHDSLFAKAVVVDDGNLVIALVTIDCIGLLYPDVLRIRKEATALTGIPESRIIVSSTHTHSGPDVVGIWGMDYQHSGVDTAYMKFLITTAAHQVKKAYDNRQEASLFSSETIAGESWVENICDEEIDLSVSILQFISKTGSSIATLTNFACHPTYLDAKYSEVSSDYVGGFYKAMNNAYGGENLFLQGAIGGWVQPVDGEGSFEKAQRRGEELAYSVTEALKTADPLADHTLRLNSVTFKLPVENEGWKQLAAIGTINRDIADSVETEIAWFAIGPAQFATHPGETTPFLGLQTKLMMETGPRFVLGLSLDAMGYIIKPEYFDDKTKPHAEYLTRMSLGRETSPIIERMLRKIIPGD
jgi:hypothetical protein